MFLFNFKNPKALVNNKVVLVTGTGGGGEAIGEDAEAV